MRTVIFGVDGLAFRVLYPLIKQGELPNFRKLSLEGCQALLKSQYPPLTPPAWMSLSTGAGFKQGFNAPNAEVYDLVPTVLHSMGLPLPYEFDGRVLNDLFVEEDKQAEQLPASNDTQGGLARRKLKKLLEV